MFGLFGMLLRHQQINIRAGAHLGGSVQFRGKAVRARGSGLYACFGKGFAQLLQRRGGKQMQRGSAVTVLTQPRMLNFVQGFRVN